MRLEYERERREGLEAELDQLRKQLQHTTAEMHHCKMLLREQKVKTTIESVKYNLSIFIYRQLHVHQTMAIIEFKGQKHRSHSKRQSSEVEHLSELTTSSSPH